VPACPPRNRFIAMVAACPHSTAALTIIGTADKLVVSHCG
jgi:hypothetical protein